MSNPVLVEVVRGDLVESRHRGAFAVMGGAGLVLASAGEIDLPVFPRSAVKTWQAAAVVESGAADAAGFTEAELALACASHDGARRHVQTAEAMLNKVGAGVGDLECGAQPVRDPEEARRLARQGAEPTPLHNNCSGKHAAFLALARHLGAPLKGYTQPDHPVQIRVRETLGAICKTDPARFGIGTDGCSAPNFSMPLLVMAFGLARCAEPWRLEPRLGAAVRRLFAAQAAYPEMVAGEGRLDTGVIRATRGDAIIKTGAEGVYAAMLPSRGLAIAVKIDDGATRAAESIVCEWLVRSGVLEAGAPVLQPFHKPAQINWRGLVTGQIRPASALFG